MTFDEFLEEAVKSSSAFESEDEGLGVSDVGVRD
jgi:hypothetical protein